MVGRGRIAGRLGSLASALIVIAAAWPSESLAGVTSTTPVIAIDVTGEITLEQQSGITAALGGGQLQIKWIEGGAKAAPTSNRPAELVVQATSQFVALDFATASTTANTAERAIANSASDLTTALEAVRLQLAAADQLNAIDAAFAHATRLRSLLKTSQHASTAPQQALLAKYPEVDARPDSEYLAVTVEIANLTSQSPVAFAIDYQPVRATQNGTGFTIPLAGGLHLVSASDGVRRRASFITLTPGVQSVRLDFAPTASEQLPTKVSGELAPAHAEQLARWSAHALSLPEQTALVAAIAESSGARKVAVFDGSSSTLWQRTGEGVWGQVGLAKVRSVTELARFTAALREDRLPDEMLLRDSDLAPRNNEQRQGTKWWVYASIVGAAAASAALIFASDNRSDTQQVRVLWR